MFIQNEKIFLLLSYFTRVSLLHRDVGVVGRLAFAGDQRGVGAAILSPIDDQRFANAEEHDTDLSDREETPDRRLFHQIRSDQTSQIRTEDEQKYTLNDHAFLLVQGEERGEHQK